MSGDPRSPRVQAAEETILDLHAEIERLRAALYEIVGLEHHNHAPTSNATKIARAALAHEQNGDNK